MLTALLLSASVATVPIHVGRFNPADFPNAEKVERRMPQAELNRRVENILASGQCSISGQNKERFDIVVPYAVQMQPTGSATKVVVKEMGCMPVERLVGEVASELSKHGDFKPKHQSGEQWYVGEVYFTRASEEAMRTMKDQDKVICRAEQDMLGSRVRKQRVCKTVAEWKVFTRDREQLRRDMTMSADPYTN
jgi:hypothetical protein